MESFFETPVSLRFFGAIVRYEVALWGRVELAVADACGIKLGSFTALQMIAERDGQGRVQDVAVDLGITIGAVSKIVDRLERSGHVRRLPNELDRRSSLIEVTAVGAEVVDRGLQVMADELQAHLQPMLTDAQLDQTTRMVEGLTKACLVADRRVAS
jgi:DNA-binding MarR family transcriptional regulator